jgi:hypothetical protein
MEKVFVKMEEILAKSGENRESREKSRDFGENYRYDTQPTKFKGR